MAFGGTRTHHRLACAIEDAGWEIRDCVTYFHDGNQAEAALMASLDEEQLAAYLELHYPNHQMSWVYGSGIGLGYDVSKGIDKSKGAEREVVGTMKITGQALGQTKGFKGTYEGKQEYKKSWGITAPSTPLAAKFDGWKSRLKPAHEIIIVAMAPMPGSYAANAEAWGVAGLWIDGARIPTNGEARERKDSKPQNSNIFLNGSSKVVNVSEKWEQGRYPANVILGISGDRYKLRDDITGEQLEELNQWLRENV
jgi:site-specific DNA-methyltransferase (adenine-specific)